MTEIVLLKLGGSLVTDKLRPDTVRPEVLARLAGEIAAALADANGETAGESAEASPRCRLVLGHGSGSFGHAAAARSGVHRGLGDGLDETTTKRRAGVSATQERAAALHHLVLDALREAGLAPYSIAPSSALVADDGQPADLAAEPIVLALRSGLLPVLFGDVVMDRAQGCAICSTESVLLALDDALRSGPDVANVQVRRALWAGATPGVLDADGRPIRSLSPATAETALSAARGAAGTDVTGGMLHRVEAAVELARRGVESLIFDGREPGAVHRALRASLGALGPASAGNGQASEAVQGTRVLPETPDRPD